MGTRLSRLPAYVIPSNGTGKIVDIESVHPNTINLVADLIDKITDGDNLQNDWSVLSRYLGEFKLDEVLIDLFSVQDPKLLKGFLRGKGTKTDLDYVLKNLGIDIRIIEADEIYENLSLTGQIANKYEDVLGDLIRDGVTDQDIIDQLIWRVRRVNNIDPEIVNNDDPQLVVNFPSSCEDILAGLGYEWTPERCAAINQMVEDWELANNVNLDLIDCHIEAIVTYDLDATAVDTALIRDINELLRRIIENRLLPHIRLRGVSLIISMSDTYNIRDIGDEVEFKVKSTITDDPTDPDALSDQFSIDQVECQYSSSATTSVADDLDQDVDDSYSSGIVVRKVHPRSYDYLLAGADMYDERDQLHYEGSIGSSFIMTTGFDI